MPRSPEFPQIATNLGSAVTAGSISDISWFRRSPHSLELLPVTAIGGQASARVVTLLQASLARRGHAVLLPSAGRSPRSTYAILRSVHRHGIDWSRVICVQMDEYMGLGDRDPRSLADELRRELVEPLRIGRFIRFNRPDGALWTCFGKVESCYGSGCLPLVSGGADEVQ